MDNSDFTPPRFRSISHLIDKIRILFNQLGNMEHIFWTTYSYMAILYSFHFVRTASKQHVQIVEKFSNNHFFSISCLVPCRTYVIFLPRRLKKRRDLEGEMSLQTYFKKEIWARRGLNIWTQNWNHAPLTISYHAWKLYPNILPN